MASKRGDIMWVKKKWFCVTHLFCIGDLYAAIDKNSFPFGQCCVFTSLHKCDRLSFCQRRVDTGSKGNRRSLIASRDEPRSN